MDPHRRGGARRLRRTPGGRPQADHDRGQRQQGQAPETFNEAVLAHFGTIPARQVLGPGEGGTAAGGESAYPVAFRGPCSRRSP